MLGARQGFTARGKQLNPNVQVVHCLLHRENLGAQHLSPKLSLVMQEIVAVLNFTKSSAVNSCLFEKVCVDLGSEFKLLRRVVDLRTEVQIFLKEKNHRHAIRFQDKEWILTVCYLNDIFNAVNDLNTSIQGRNQNIITLSEKLSAFKEKLQLCRTKLERGRTAMFPSMNKYLEEWSQIVISRFEVFGWMHGGFNGVFGKP